MKGVSGLCEARCDILSWCMCMYYIKYELLKIQCSFILRTNYASFTTSMINILKMDLGFTSSVHFIQLCLYSELNLYSCYNIR